MTEKRWEHFPHGADIGVRGFGSTREEAFENAALALTAVLTDPGGVAPRETVEIRCEAPDDELLLVDWLNALVYEMSTRGMIFGTFDVRIANGRLEGDGWSLPNPGFEMGSHPPDRRALLGVRSEDLSLDVRDESAALDGTVYAVEPLGDRTLVDIEIGSHRVVVKAAPTASPAIGDRVRAAVDLERVHLFDAETEAAIPRS